MVLICSNKKGVEVETKNANTRFNLIIKEVKIKREKIKKERIQKKNQNKINT